MTDATTAAMQQAGNRVKGVDEANYGAVDEKLDAAINKSKTGTIANQTGTGTNPAQNGWIMANYLNSVQNFVPNVNKNLTKAQQPVASNNLTPAKTLKYSRLADQLNNRLMWQPGTTDKDGNITSGNQAYKAPDIQTAETRQQQRNEAYEQQYQQNELARQAAARNYPLTQQQMLDQYRLAIAQNYDQAKLNAAEKVWGLAPEEFMQALGLQNQEQLIAYKVDVDVLDAIRKAGIMAGSNNEIRAFLAALFQTSNLSQEAGLLANLTGGAYTTLNYLAGLDKNTQPQEYQKALDRFKSLVYGIRTIHEYSGQQAASQAGGVVSGATGGAASRATSAGDAIKNLLEALGITVSRSNLNEVTGGMQ